MNNSAIAVFTGTVYGTVKFIQQDTTIYTIVWNTGLFKKPPYKKLMNRIKRYPGFTRDIVISPRT